MLLQFTELVREAGVLENFAPLGVQADAIRVVRPGDVSGYQAACTRLEIEGEDGPVFVQGQVDDVLRTIGAADQQSLAKLAAIRAILED
jgi:hypothetical protein